MLRVNSFEKLDQVEKKGEGEGEIGGFCGLLFILIAVDFWRWGIRSWAYIYIYISGVRNGIDFDRFNIEQQLSFTISLILVTCQ